MKSTFIIPFVLLFGFGCKQAMNGTSSIEKETLSNSYSKKSYLTIPHEDGQSVIRNKLLNQKLTDILKKDNESTIEIGDEFRFLNEDYSGVNKNDYATMGVSSAEVLVSYHDRLEIYFVPPGISSKQIVRDLNLQEEDSGNFSWFPGNFDKAEKGKKYFLLNASLEEVKTNDQKFYSEKFDIASFASKKLKFSNNQKIIFHFTINAQFKDTTNSLVSIRNKVGPMMTDCTYTIEKLTGSYSVGDWKNSGVEISLEIDGTQHPLKDFETTLEYNSVRSEIDLSKFTKDKTVNVSLLPLKVPSQSKQVRGYNYLPFCMNQNVVETLDVTPKVEASYELEVKGRTLNF